MPRAQRHADLRIVLEAADAGAVPARIDDQVGPLGGVDDHAVRRLDVNERVIDGALELPAVEHDVVVEMQHRLGPARALDVLPRSRSVSQNSSERWTVSTA